MRIASPPLSSTSQRTNQLPDPQALRELQRQTGLALIAVRLADMPLVLQRPWLPLRDTNGNADLPLLYSGPDGLLFGVQTRGG